MPKERVREAIDDMLRRGLTDLDPVIAIMRRGPAALDELALAAERPAVKAALVEAVRRQAQRFATATASLQKGVRQHGLTVDLLRTVDVEVLIRAALAAWDEGRPDEATYLTEAAAATGQNTAELQVAEARAAAAAAAPERAADLYGSALDQPLPDRLVVEAAGALFDIVRTEAGLRGLAARGETVRRQFIGQAAAACLRGEAQLVAAVCAGMAGDDQQREALLTAIKGELMNRAGQELAPLAGAVVQLRETCHDMLVAANELALQDGSTGAAARVTEAAAGAASAVDDVAAIAKLAALVRTPDRASQSDVDPADLIAAANEYARRRFGLHIEQVDVNGTDADKVQSAAPLDDLGELLAWLVWSRAATNHNRCRVTVSGRRLCIPLADSSGAGASGAALRDCAFYRARAALVSAGCALIPQPSAMVVTLPEAYGAAGALQRAVRDALERSGGAVLEPVAAALLSIATELRSAAGIAAAAGAARSAMARSDQLVLYLQELVRPASPLPQPASQVVDAAVAGIRLMLAERAISLQVTMGTATAIRVDREQLVTTLKLLCIAAADRVPSGGALSLELTGDPAAGMARIVVRSAAGLPLTPAPLAAVLADRLAAALGGEVTALTEVDRTGYALSLPAVLTPPAPIGLADLTPDAQMALRAAAGVLSGGDAETACFLIGKGVSAEASRRLRPQLARHLLLPSATFALSSGVAKSGLADQATALPGRRIEDLCRSVVDDRLLRRLSDVRSYGLCLAVFALPHKGWPEPVRLPGLSDAELRCLTGSLRKLSDLLEAKNAQAALDLAAAILRLLLRVQLP